MGARVASTQPTPLELLALLEDLLHSDTAVGAGVLLELFELALLELLEDNLRTIVEGSSSSWRDDDDGVVSFTKEGSGKITRTSSSSAEATTEWNPSFWRPGAIKSTVQERIID